jgi:hypothetical protein
VHPKKVLPNKPIFLANFQLVKQFFGKNFFWVHFLLRSYVNLVKQFFGQNFFLGALFTKIICKFLKSVRKDGLFDAPFDLFKEIKFSSLFENLKGQKWKKPPANIGDQPPVFSLSPRLSPVCSLFT